MNSDETLMELSHAFHDFILVHDGIPYREFAQVFISQAFVLQNFNAFDLLLQACKVERNLCSRRINNFIFYGVQAPIVQIDAQENN